MEDKKNIEKAISLGKIWMKNSVDDVHNHNHASRVEEFALTILDELKPKNVDKDMVRLAVWWHDAYKARCKYVTFDSILNEGYKSSVIFKEQVGPLLDFKTMSMVSNAIINHTRLVKLFLSNKGFDELSLILIEADQLDGLNSRRNNRELKKIKNPFVYFFDRFLTALVPIFYLRIRRSQFGKAKLKKYVLGK